MKDKVVVMKEKVAEAEAALDVAKEKLTVVVVAADRKRIASLAQTTDQDGDTVDQEEVDEAVKILVRNATEAFGFAPRDVYRGIFNLPEMKDQHTDAVRDLDYSSLKTLVKAFASNRELDSLPHQVVAVYPRCPSGDIDTREIDFKSIRIARAAVRCMRVREDENIRETFQCLHEIPESSVLAGWVFEAIAHRALSDRSINNCVPMLSNGTTPPTFSTPDDPSSSLSTSLSFAGRRVVKQVNFARGLVNVTLDRNVYYTPTASNHPLFDSFTVDCDRRPVTISVFQITISSRHGGLDTGYFYVRRIKTHIRKLLIEAGYGYGVKIEVAYYLVCPDDGLKRQWDIVPDGWDAGKAFCIRVPSADLTVRRVRHS